MHPRVVLAYVDHVHVERVQPGLFDRRTKSVLVQVGGTGGNHDAVEPVLPNILTD